MIGLIIMILCCIVAGILFNSMEEPETIIPLKRESDNFVFEKLSRIIN